MTTCEEHGDSVLVYDEYDCPACEAIEDLHKEYRSTIDDLENQVSEGDEKIAELTDELAGLKNE